MVVYFRETRETIDLLRRVVDKLDEYNGCIGAQELWDGVQCVPANVGSPDFTVARHGIRQMKVVFDGLKSFMYTLVSTHKAHIHSTRRRARIPQLTIGSLPPEIILHIVSDALDCTKPRWLLRYSHVSSKIRNVILDSPSLWASVQLTLDIPLWLIKAIISRSAALNLTVVIDDSSFSTKSLRSDSFVSKLSAVFEHQHRWREATFAVTEESAKLIQEHFPRANLASVRVLRVNKMKINFIENWDIPRLEKLEWSSSDPLLPPSDMATYTCLLSLGDVRAQDVMSVAAFLNNATGLRTLKLQLINRDNSREPGKLPEIRLSCLEHLEFGVTDWSIGIAARLLEAILCPGLKRLYLSVAWSVDYYNALTQGMRGRYPLLTFFKLSWIGGRGRPGLFFDELLSSLPSTIQKVQLGGECSPKLHTSRRVGSIPNNFCAPLPYLKDLYLDCDDGEENFYANLSDMLKKFHVTLNHFQPSTIYLTMTRAEIEGARKTLRRAGVLVDLNPTSRIREY